MNYLRKKEREEYFNYKMEDVKRMGGIFIVSAIS